MKYGLTVYGPLQDTASDRQLTTALIATAFPVDYKQIQTVWETMRNFPDFNSVEIIMRTSGDLVIHVYYSPVDVPEDADCAFHAKITRDGTYA